MRFLGLVALMAQALAVPALAADRALVIGLENYSFATDLSGAGQAGEAAQALRAAGFVTTIGRDSSAADLRVLLSGLIADLAPEDRLVLLVAGHFAQSQTQSWVLGADANRPDLAMVGGAGVSVATLLEIAALATGRAVVLLGTETHRLPLGSGLQGPGIGAPAIPQGVALITGEASDIIGFATRKLPRRGVSLASLLQGETGLKAQGFLPPSLPFRPTAGAVLAPATPQSPVTTQTLAERLTEDQDWEKARKTATVAGYDSFLRLYPRGRYSAQAQAELTRLRADPQNQAQLAEEALALSRDARRTIQRQLSLLGHDPRGIDGLFGRGSRAAIAAWQKANGLRATGYLNRDQITVLTAAADRRAAELEAEAAARKVEQDRQDRLYWQQSGAVGDEAGLRAYLKRHPDGLFADTAKDQLAVIEAERRATAAGRDRAAWDAAQAANSDQSYRVYLRDFPQGAFAPEARARIEALQGDPQEEAARARAEAAEAALGLPALARTLIERRLSDLGFDPGPADGQFDTRTRRAIRRFQAANGQPASGFLDQAAVVSLLAGGVFRFGE